MQLDLGSDPRTEILRKAHRLLIDHFGRIVRPPDKRRDPVWTLVQGVIGARTKTAVSNENTDRLLSEYGTWQGVAAAPEDELAEKLRTATFPDISAKRLKSCLNEIIDQRGSVTLTHLHNAPTRDAMDWLESLPGIARKISAQIVNTSTLDRKAMVIETGHLRVLARMGLVPPKADTKRAYDELAPHLPEEWTAADIDEHHLLMKRLGQVICRPKRPDCAVCPLRNDCRTGTEALRRG